MFGFRDNSGTSVPVFSIPFTDNFRGTSQPAAAFNLDNKARIFFVGTRFSPQVDCLNNFDSVLYAVTGTGAAAYNLPGTDNLSMLFAGKKINAVRVAGGQLALDVGLSDKSLKPPPPPPPQKINDPNDPNPTNRSDVFTSKAIMGSLTCR
jgi:hypothetical protein